MLAMEEQKSFEEFNKSISGRKKGSMGKVTGSLRSQDIYALMRKNHWYDIGRPITKKEFHTIVRGIGDLIAEELAMGNTIRFPAKMGLLELKKMKSGASIRDGKLKVTYPVDWLKTKQLWFEDHEAYKNRTLIRHENKWVYRMKYYSSRATYENKCFYQFTLNTFIKRALAQNIKQGKIDTLW